MTGLPNRRTFQERLEFALARRAKSELELLFLDLDGFKLVNDTPGHDVGDELLKTVAERLVACLARLAGDKFTILLTQVTSSEQVEGAADRVWSRSVSRLFCRGALFILVRV